MILPLSKHSTTLITAPNVQLVSGSNAAYLDTPLFVGLIREARVAFRKLRTVTQDLAVVHLMQRFGYSNFTSKFLFRRLNGPCCCRRLRLAQNAARPVFNCCRDKAPEL